MFMKHSVVSFSLKTRFSHSVALISRFPAILTYIEAMREFVGLNGYTETIFGRKRYIPEIHSRAPHLRASAERMAINHPLQGSAADIMKMAMVATQEEIEKEKLDCRLLLQIHDELLLECSDDLIQKVAVNLKDIMEGVVQLRVVMQVDVKKGSTWGNLKSI